MAIDPRVLGAAIKQVRTARGLTQTELAQAVGFSSAGKSIALIEQGRRQVSVKSLNSLANALSIPPACLAILGSRATGKDKSMKDFIESLKHLISTVIVAQTSLTQSKQHKLARRNGQQPGVEEISVSKVGKLAKRKPKARRKVAAS